MKRVGVFIGIILLLAGVWHEEKQRAQTMKNHLSPVVLPDVVPSAFVIRPSNFSDNVDLWGGPGMKSDVLDASYASLVFQNDLEPASFNRLQSKLDDKSEPAFTVQNRQVNYSIFEAGGFTFMFNLKPAYLNSQGLFPSRIDPGIGASFSF
jgi:hypothetical protein